MAIDDLREAQSAQFSFPKCEEGSVARLAQSVVEMRRSGIRVVMDLAGTMKDVIHLEVGEPSFQTPAHIVEAAHRAALEGFTKYTPNVGFLSLREKLVQKLQRVNGLQTEPDNIVVTPGAVAGIVSSLAAILEPGDEVLIPDPGWPNNEMMVIVNRGVPRQYLLDPANGFIPDLDELEKAITLRTKAIVINSPSNPTGAVFPRATVERLVEIVREHDIFLVSDEVYEQILFDAEHVSARGFDIDGRVISVHGFSKTYAMTGWRLGYVVASREVAAMVGKLQEPLVSCASAVSQKAGEAALDGPQDCVVEMVEAYRRRRDMAVSMLADLDVPFSRPSGAFYLLVDVSSAAMESYEFAKLLLKEARVAVAPGATFGQQSRNHVRLSLATADGQLAEGIRRLAAFLRGSRAD